MLLLSAVARIELLSYPTYIDTNQEARLVRYIRNLAKCNVVDPRLVMLLMGQTLPDAAVIAPNFLTQKYAPRTGKESHADWQS